MLTRLRFTNFKSWPEADLTLGRVTGLFGTNSSGKTSIIQFLLMLKQTKEATDRAISLELNGDYVGLGTFKDVVHGHDQERAIEYDVEWSDRLSIQDPESKKSTELVRGERVSVSSEISGSQGAPRARSLRYALGGAEFRLAPKRDDQSQFDLTTTIANGFRFKRQQGRPWQLPGPVKSYAFPDQARTYYQNAGFLSDLEAAFESLMDRTYYLGPLREYPHRDYLWARSRPGDVGSRGQKAIDAILSATDNGERRNLTKKSPNKSFQEMIAYWLRQMGLIDDFGVEEIAPGSNRWQAKIKTRRDSVEVLLTDVGFGVSQVLPVITLLYYVPEGSTVILEQPEIHLHPLAQAHLADLILAVAERRRVQVILESHSEHLLLRLQRRIAEGRADASDVKLYFCDIEGGASKLVPLDLDLFGNIQNWPRNFMGDQFGETAAAEKARLRRQLKAAE